MKVDVMKDGALLTVKVDGRVDTITAPELEKTVLDNLNGITELILDLEKMPYTSSAGLRVLLKAKKAVKNMKLVHVCSDVMEVLEMTGFTDIMTIEA
ncbi:MAG: STAS domain-containing protein [Eubacterium sp.]|nr:STAS domain-containing protein [Eubacterium sp.]